jgi:hypothetical protein
MGAVGKHLHRDFWKHITVMERRRVTVNALRVTA